MPTYEQMAELWETEMAMNRWIADRNSRTPYLNNLQSNNHYMANSTSDLTFGQKAVGLKSNPSNDDKVSRIKQKSADLIDELNEQREATQDFEERDQYTLAIRSIQVGQMWGVNAATSSL